MDFGSDSDGDAFGVVKVVFQAGGTYTAPGE